MSMPVWLVWLSAAQLTMASVLTRSASFPASFIFGVSTSSVQIEGATSEGGRGKGIWDIFASIPGNIVDGSTPSVACDHFHKFQDDILEMKRLGVDAYRFSISWPRLFPENSHKLDKRGLAFYTDLLDCILDAGLIPFMTLYHWDLPQYLHDDPEVKGWLTMNIIGHFLIFAETCFFHFGDRVRHWITINEIHMNAVLSYESGIMAPGRSSSAGGDSYIVAHHQLLAHAAAVKLYRRKYQKEQQGSIGLCTDIQWYEPLSETQEDIDAVARCLEFEMGWILDPVFFGDYPQLMKDLVGDGLPKFTEEESQDLKGSIDFVGLNYYFALWATKAGGITGSGLNAWVKESGTNFCWVDANGRLLGKATGPPGVATFRSCPWGLKKVLVAIQSRYGKIPIYITENGSTEEDIDRTSNGPHNDQLRIEFLQDHLSTLSDAMRVEEVNVRGYFYWTMTDNWEWMSGFTKRFGLYHIDFNNPELPRTPKASAAWFSSFLRS